MDWFARQAKLAYFPAKPIVLSDKWERIRNIARHLPISKDAQLKLEWMIFYHTVGGENARFTAKHFGISRKTFYKWLGRFDEKDLRTLEEQSRRPNKVRDWMVTQEEERRIAQLRKNNMEFGKKKLQVLYQREHQEYVSTWKIERVIQRRKLYPDPVKHKYSLKRKHHKPKLRIHLVKKALGNIKVFGFLWHIDAIIIWWYGQRRVIFTAIEELTKIAFARVYTTNSSAHAEDFLKRLMYLVEGKVNIMHQDNGSEFEGAFKRACETLGIVQIYSRPRTPKDNPSLEKFNDTVQREWLRFSEIGLDEIEESNKDLTRWLVKYNSYRPHQALDYMTPLEYAQEHFFKVSPMWSASTHWVIVH